MSKEAEFEQSPKDERKAAVAGLEASLETFAEDIAAIREMSDKEAKRAFDDFARKYYPGLRFIAERNAEERRVKPAEGTELILTKNGHHGINVNLGLPDNGYVEFQLADPEIIKSPDQARGHYVPNSSGKIAGAKPDSSSGLERSYFDYFNPTANQLADFAHAISIAAAVAVESENTVVDLTEN